MGLVAGAAAVMCLNRVLCADVKAPSENTVILESEGTADVMSGTAIGGYITTSDLTESEEHH